MEFIYQTNEEIQIRKYLELIGYSRDMFKKIKNSIFVNDSPIRLWQTFTKSDILKVILPEEDCDIIPHDHEIEIVFEDEYMMVVNKPKGLYSMPINKIHQDSLANYLISYFQKNNLKITIHLVNRLDKETKGLILVAKHQFIHSLLIKQKMIKKYYAVVNGIIKKNGIIDLPIAKGEGIKRTISAEGKNSVTHYQVIEIKNNKTMLDIQLITGRTHQIRVHFAHIGNPLVGDSLYGVGSNLALQSYYLELIHPITKNTLIFCLLNELEGDLYD